jgi:UDP-N-acetylmuramyl pentapeptide phosphotransferase/UDP-N-acetylglucosamine-1-phosphate transferase
MKTLFPLIILTAITATILMNTLGKKVKKQYSENAKMHHHFSNKKE